MKEKRYLLIRFGRKVKAEREKRHLSQEALGSKAKLHRTFIGMIERGEKNSTLETIQKLAEALDLNIPQLMDF